jgi:hypothetical protein
VVQVPNHQCPVKRVLDFVENIRFGLHKQLIPPAKACGQLRLLGLQGAQKLGPFTVGHEQVLPHTEKTADG